MSNISGWTEAIIFSLVFVAILGVVIVGFNVKYSKNYSLDLNDTSQSRFITYQNSSQQQIKGGEVSLDTNGGITLKSSYGIVTDIIDIIWSFITGGWIEKIATMLNVGTAGALIAGALRVLWFLSLVFALIAILFKVIP